MSSMAESLAQLREEKEELQMEVESLKMTGAIDTGNKGNSLFSEVN